MIWTKEKVVDRLRHIEQKGFIAIPNGTFRSDDGIVGQVLERQFQVRENNIHLADLGVFELKAMRYRKSRSHILTLFHQTSSSGMTPIEIFERFGYIRRSVVSGAMKKKLFTTVRGDRFNNLGFILKPYNEDEFDLYYKNEYLATWDLSFAKSKIRQVILAFAETRGPTNSAFEEFHYFNALLLSDANSLAEAIRNGAVVMDFCIDQPLQGTGKIHDRGPHIRIPVKKLHYLFNHIEEILC